MKAFIAALFFITAASVGASLVLDQYQRSGAAAFTTSGARVGDPGRNLIGS